MGVSSIPPQSRVSRALVLSLLVMSAILLGSEGAAAADLRVIDVSGLVRGVSVVKSAGAVSLSYSVTGSTPVTCTMKNIDGLSNDRSVVGSSTAEGQGQCLFPALTPGTWQATVEGGARWQVRITGVAE